MKTKIKYSLIGLIIGIILTTATPVLADSIIQKIDVIFNSVQVQVNGEKLDANSILYNGSTYLPMRTVAEAVGKDIDWNQETMTANIIDKKVNNIETTLPTIVDYGFRNSIYAVTFSDGFIVAVGPTKNEVNALPLYKSILLLISVESMDKNVVISKPNIEAFNKINGNKYYPINYDIYSTLLPEKSRESFKKIDFFENFKLRKNGEDFGGSLYYESSSSIDGVNYDDGVHKCTLYLEDKN